MGWRGTLRTLGAVARRMEREEKRQGRLVERESKLFLKQLNREMAGEEVEQYESRMGALLSVHKECGDTLDWSGILDSPPPDPPIRSNLHELRATGQLNAFVPGFLDKLLGRSERKAQALTVSVYAAQKEDENEYQTVYAKYVQDHEAWSAKRQLAFEILQGNLEAYADAIGELAPFAELLELGCSVDLTIPNRSVAEVVLKVDGDKCMPMETKTLLASGKVSAKPMPKGKRHEHYEDFVCGCVLRVTRELFAILPVELVLATARADLLNSKTGIMETSPILSVALPRQTIEKLVFQTLDPSQSLANFVHRSGFKRSTGFSAVEKLSLDDLSFSVTPSQMA